MSEPTPQPPPASEPASPDEAVLAIQRHRAAIVEAQHRVLRKEITVAEYNEAYRQHLDAIHAMERWLQEFQAKRTWGPGQY